MNEPGATAPQPAQDVDGAPLTVEQLDDVVAGYDSPPPGYRIYDYKAKLNVYTVVTPHDEYHDFATMEEALAWAWAQRGY